MMNRAWVVWTLVLIQCLCGAYFLWEILASILGIPSVPLRWNVRELVEAGASIGLILGAFLGVRLALVAQKATHRAETARRITSGEFTTVVESYFKKLGLTGAETEIAWLVLKGMSMAEIANLRQTRIGTVKAQCTAIYRKAGVSGKSQLISQLVEDLLF
ncbi:helix-turn-helix transcriptional regulator [uncultured Ruegeria sp.]|uniref:helix-turn-helix transcriptional regulator n=1 Tax=uncultured Ruegeria sp. TaxID=259304 RepID=UPI002620D5E5|nr:helix-turn-helix transcriptional regulator [uncultured Ruegeria sp.]